MQSRTARSNEESRQKMNSTGIEETAVITPQYFLQGNHLCGGRVAGSPLDLAECVGVDGNALQLQLCHHVCILQVFLLPQAVDIEPMMDDLLCLIRSVLFIRHPQRLIPERSRK